MGVKEDGKDPRVIYGIKLRNLLRVGERRTRWKGKSVISNSPVCISG
jgi:hypothetical protein